jgi:uncharacterized protein (DUF488 family)
MEYVLHTIGHSAHPIGRFCDVLGEHAVNAVADVRSAPYSRRNPQFNKENIQTELDRCGIAYVFLGAELGARPRDPGLYKNGRVAYELVARTEAFQRGLSRVRVGLTRFRVALMCAEGDPVQCHRMILVCRHLKCPELSIQHILPSGETESQDDAERRLLRLHSLDHGDFFSEGDELVAQAYLLQEKAIAHSQPQKPNEQLAASSV